MVRIRVGSGLETLRERNAWVRKGSGTKCLEDECPGMNGRKGMS